MSCFGCESTQTTAVRLGCSWCAACLDALEFEERLAAANGLFIADVVLRDGKVCYAFAHRRGDWLTHDEISRIGVTQADVLHQILDAARLFRESLLLVGDRIAGVNRDAPRRARQFIEIATQLEPLLAEEEKQVIAHMLDIARSVAATVH